MDSRQVLVVFIPKRYTSLARNPFTQSITFRNKPMTNDELLSKTISWLRFPLIVGVVFIHNNFTENGITVQGITYEIENPFWYNTIVNIFSEVLPRVAVPLFFLISGFLFFYHTDFDGRVYKRKLKGRARTLLVPYLIWSVIAFLYPLTRSIPGLQWLFPNATGFEFDLHEFFKGFWTATNLEGPEFMPRDYPLWFVRELMVVVLFTPVIHWLIRRTNYLIVFLLGVLWYIEPWSRIPALSLPAWFFFVLGAYFSIKKINPLYILRNYQWLPWLYLAIAIVDTITKEADYNDYIHKIGILVGMASCFILVGKGLKNGRLKINKFLSDGSFFVFAAHAIILPDMRKVFSKLLLPDSAVSFTILYFLVPIVTILLCLFVYRLLKRYLPRVAAVVTGGR